NVEFYLDNRLTAEDILAMEYKHVILATGAGWRDGGVGVTNWQAIPGADQNHVITPEDIFSGRGVNGPVVVFDDDNYYMGALIAEMLKLDAHEVTLVTPATQVSSWTEHTLEQHRIQAHVLELGIGVVTSKNITRIGSDAVETACVYTDKPGTLPATTVVLVTSRQPNDELLLELNADSDRLADAGISSVTAIG
ncbi:MAG: NADH:flavin oxidoreductase, partial [Gammaproteobacteria bacterium]|nr:NADH:flavin oxidoreductase [Gammaproteobacteria bacterium]